MFQRNLNSNSNFQFKPANIFQFSKLQIPASLYINSAKNATLMRPHCRPRSKIRINWEHVAALCWLAHAVGLAEVSLGLPNCKGHQADYGLTHTHTEASRRVCSLDMLVVHLLWCALRIRNATTNPTRRVIYKLIAKLRAAHQKNTHWQRDSVTL